MSDNAKPELPPPSLWRTVLNLLPLIILTWYLCQNRPDKNPDYQLDLCGKNMHEMGVALEKDRLLSGDLLYNADFSKVFPEGKIPACPVGGDDAYKEGYQVSADRTSYLLVCKGDHHKEAGVPSDYPRIGFSVQEASSNGSSDSKEEDKIEPEESPTPAESPQPEQSPEAQASPELQVSPTPGTTPNP